MSRSNALVLMAIAYFQPITRGELSQFLGQGGFAETRSPRCAARGSSPPGRAARRPARPTPMSPRRGSWRNSGSRALRDLPDIEKLEDAGLLGRTSEALLDGDALASELRGVLGQSGGEDEPEEDAA